MTVLTIPTRPGVAYQRQKLRLEGRDYILKLSYNQREERFYVSIFDDEETELVLGLKLVSNWPLLKQYHADTRLPPGELMAIDTTGDNSPPTLDELGQDKRVTLMYFTADEVAAVAP